jgi:hypothetical protein
MEVTILRPVHNKYYDSKVKKIKLDFLYPTFTLFFKYLLKNKDINLTIDSFKNYGFDNIWYVNFRLPQDTPQLDEKNQERYYILNLYVREYSGDFENRSPGTFKYYPDRPGHTFEDHFEGELDDIMGDCFDLNMPRISENIFQSYDGILTTDVDEYQDDDDNNLAKTNLDKTNVVRSVIYY